MHKAEKAKNANAPNTYLDKAITFEQSQYFHPNYVTPDMDVQLVQSHFALAVSAGDCLVSD
jgi:hypothetical protein